MKIRDRIKFTISHDTGYNNQCFLIGEYKGQLFIESFNVKSWFNISLRFAKYLIITRFKIIYG